MKIICNQKNLNTALQLVSRATSTKSTLPVLNNVLIEAKEGNVTLSTTNLEIGIKYVMKADVQEEGKVTVPVKIIGQYISLLQTDTVELSLVDEQTVHLRAKGSDTQIKGIKSDEFPILPEVKEEYSISLPSGELNNAIEQTVFASALDETRPVLAGIYFEMQNKTLKVVATDSYRLAEKKLTVSENGEEIKKLIVPSRTIMEVGRILSHTDKDVTMKVSKNQIVFEVDNVTLVSRLIEGQFPPYEQIIPGKHETRVKVVREELMQTVKRASLFSQENASNMKFEVVEGRLKIKAEADQVGNEIAEIPAEIEGPTKEIAFNAQFILDGLNAIKSDEILFDVISETSPGVLRSPDKDDYLYIVMPLKI